MVARNSEGPECLIDSNFQTTHSLPPSLPPSSSLPLVEVHPSFALHRERMSNWHACHHPRLDEAEDLTLREEGREGGREGEREEGIREERE